MGPPFVFAVCGRWGTGKTTLSADPNRLLLVDNYESIPILTTATLNIDAAYVAAKVADAARSALLSALSFESLEFAESVHLSDVYAILQNVAGVDSVDIDRFMCCGFPIKTGDTAILLKIFLRYKKE